MRDFRIIGDTIEFGGEAVGQFKNMRPSLRDDVIAALESYDPETPDLRERIRELEDYEDECEKWREAQAKVLAKLGQIEQDLDI